MARRDSKIRMRNGFWAGVMKGETILSVMITKEIVFPAQNSCRHEMRKKEQSGRFVLLWVRDEKSIREFLVKL